MATWMELQLPVPRGLADRMTARLMQIGSAGVQEDYLPGQAPPIQQPWDTGAPPPKPARVLLRAWWPEADTTAAQRALQTDGLHWAGVGEPSWAPVQDADWADAWRAGFQPIVVSPALTVAPPWQATQGDLVIEPGMAFGTGEHPTTRACLAAVDRLAKPGGSCLDVGCGTGVLALLAARHGMTAWGVDIDPEAVRASHDNASRNSLKARFDATPLPQIAGTFSLVVANLYAEVLIGMAPDLQRLCGGHLVLAGVLADRAPALEAALTGLTQVSRVVDGDWVSLEYRVKET